MRSGSFFGLSLTATTVAIGCLGEAPPAGTAQVVAEVQSIPASVGCLRVFYRLPAATADTARNFPVTPGQPASLDFGYLPAGAYSFRANAYGVACGGVNNSTQPTWVGDPTSVTVRAGFATQVELTLRPNVTTTSTVDFIQPVRAIYAGLGSNTTYAVMQDGTVRSWGRNDRGQMGDGTTATSASPRVVVGLTNPSHIDGSFAYACAATPGGLACWGQFGALLADDGSGSSLTPRFNADIEPGAVAAGEGALCGVFSDNLQCWRSVETLNGATTPAVSAAFSQWNEDPFEPDVYAVRPDGNLVRARASALPVTSFIRSRVQSVTPTTNSLCALLVSGGVSCWSLFDGVGTLGPEAAVAISDATALTGGERHVCALTAERSVRCWGHNTEGQLGGRADVSVSSAPVTVPLAEVTQVAAGRQHTCALRADGSVWCWGSNVDGQLGDGTRVNRFAPVRVRF